MAAKTGGIMLQEAVAVAKKGRLASALPVAATTAGPTTELEIDTGLESDTAMAASRDTAAQNTSLIPAHSPGLENAPTLLESTSPADVAPLDDSATAPKLENGKISNKHEKGDTSAKGLRAVRVRAKAKRSARVKTGATPSSASAEDENTGFDTEALGPDGSKTKPSKRTKAPKKVKSSSEDSAGSSKKRKAPPDEISHTKRQKLNGYGIKHGESPFPDLVSPTPEQCKEVVDILSKYHINSVPPKAVPPPSLKIAGCGEVPAVHDALLRTRISAATKTDNANNAIENLVKVYGIAENGVGKGSINWNAVRLGSREKLLQALKSAGLAGIKSNDIKDILDTVAERNMLRCEILMAEGKELTEEDKDPLTLQHIRELTTEEAYVALIQYPGIGVKTAACVILFCLQRPCYAVDTHVWRLTKDLGWVPPKANEIKTFAHCQVRVPDEYKYRLHQLFWHHGQECVRCRAGTSEKSEDWDKGCPIDHLVTRLRKERKIVAAKVKDKGNLNLGLDNDDGDGDGDGDGEGDEPDGGFSGDGTREGDSSSAQGSKNAKPKPSKSKSAEPIKKAKPAKAVKGTAAARHMKTATSIAVRTEVNLQTRYGLRSKTPGA